MNRLLTLTFFTAFLLLTSPVLAQISETIRTDRPSQSFSPYTVGTQVLQLEGGVGYSTFEIVDIQNHSIYENLVIRYGIKDKIELNALINHASQEWDYGTANDLVNKNGINQFDVGFRIHLFERPSGFTASWQTRAKLYFLVSDEFTTQDDFGFISSISMGYPFGNSMVVFNGSTSNEVPFLYTLNYSLALGDAFSTFIEIYGEYDDEFTNYVDGGFAYLINADLQLDISAGIDLDDTINAFFVEGGISYRLFGLK